MKTVLQKTVRQWLADDPFTYSASAAYYAVFSMPGLLMVTMAVADLMFDRQTVEAEILRHAQSILSADGADLLRKILDSTRYAGRSLWSVTIGTLTLLSGATGLFVQLQGSLNHIWAVKVRKTAGYVEFLKSRATALGIMVAIGFLLLVSMSITTLLTALSERLAVYLTAYAVVFLHALNVLVSLGIISFLFALMFKVLPDIHLKWRYALSGGTVSALLFMAGAYILALYFDIAKPQSPFGAAGGVVLLMLWTFYSCLIFFFGAHFTRIHAQSQRAAVEPAPIATKK